MALLVNPTPQCPLAVAEIDNSTSTSEKIMNSYDFNRSTEDNYHADPSEPYEFVGEFVQHRMTLDYDYHQHYTPERQLFQDSVIKNFLRTIVRDSRTNKYCARPSSPWVVFTAGAMGSGKSHAMKWLNQNNYFPLESFVLVDPDMIRYQLPEMKTYLLKNQTTAGTMTHKESGFIQEILSLEALTEGKNVLIDGSLRNASWNKLLFARIYKEYPNVKIAIIHVTASHDEVMRRAARRAEVTGRIVPQEVIESALEEVPRSVQELSPLVNYSITLNTDHDEPRISQVNTPTARAGIMIDETWKSFADRWVQQCMASEGVEHVDEVKGYPFVFQKEGDRKRTCLNPLDCYD